MKFKNKSSKYILYSFTALALLLMFFYIRGATPKEVILDRNELKEFEVPFEQFDLVTGEKEQSTTTTSHKIKLPISKYDELVKHTMSHGYGAWQKGEIHYNHIQLGFGLNDEVFFSKKVVKGDTLLLCYDKINHFLYLIKFKSSW